MTERAAAAVASGVLGPQLRALRHARGMTLEALAAATKLHKGYLSRLERGEKGPSIATVLTLSAALGVPVGQLFGEELPADALRVSRAGSRRAATLTGPDTHGFEPLGPAGAGALEAFVLRPAARFAAGGQHAHDGEELLYVLEGRIELRFADRGVVLQAGDSAQFPGHLPHRLRRLGDAPAAALVAVARRA